METSWRPVQGASDEWAEEDAQLGRHGEIRVGLWLVRGWRRFRDHDAGGAGRRARPSVHVLTESPIRVDLHG